MGTSSRAWLAAALLALSVGAALARTHVLRHATRPAAPQQPQSAASQQGLYSEPIVLVPVKARALRRAEPPFRKLTSARPPRA
jgi:hypothetical protein